MAIFDLKQNNNFFIKISFKKIFIKNNFKSFQIIKQIASFTTITGRKTFINEILFKKAIIIPKKLFFIFLNLKIYAISNYF